MGGRLTWLCRERGVGRLMGGVLLRCNAGNTSSTRASRICTKLTTVTRATVCIVYTAVYIAGTWVFDRVIWLIRSVSDSWLHCTLDVEMESSSAVNCRVYVGNLSWSIKSQDLKEHMLAAGPVEAATVLEWNGRSKVRSDRELLFGHNVHN